MAKITPEDIRKSKKLTDEQKEDLIGQIERNDKIEKAALGAGVAVPILLGLIKGTIFGAMDDWSIALLYCENMQFLYFKKLNIWIVYYIYEYKG